MTTWGDYINGKPRGLHDVDRCRERSDCEPFYCTECRELFEDDNYTIVEGKPYHQVICDDDTINLCGPLIDHCDKCTGRD